MGPMMRMRLGMMLWGWLLLFAGLLGGLVPVALSAQTGPSLRPAEEPPSDFAGSQYIDSHGCVFTRNGKLWAARVGRDGMPVCGYPPTPVGTLIRPHLPPALEGMGRIEAELVHAITANLAAGDLVTDPRPSARASDLPVAGLQGGEDQDRAAASVVTQIQGALSATGPIRIAVAGSTAPGRRLCASLGLDQTASHRAALGDVTAGLCSTPLPQTSALRIAEAEAGAAAAVAARSGADVAAKIRPHAERNKGQPQKTRRETKKPKASAAATRPTAIRQSPSGTRKDRSPANMIPARARYLELTGVGNDTDAALARLHALGLPASRARIAGSATPIVLAGPFHSRQSIVSAYDQLTRAGFPRLQAR